MECIYPSATPWRSRTEVESRWTGTAYWVVVRLGIHSVALAKPSTQIPWFSYPGARKGLVVPMAECEAVRALTPHTGILRILSWLVPVGHVHLQPARAA